MITRAEKLIQQALEASQPYLHWGRWIQRRADFVGLGRHAELAKVVGCTRPQIYKWFDRELPPEKHEIKKGFDRSLAIALKTTGEILFNGWRLVAPDKAPLIEGDTADDWLSIRQEQIKFMSRGLLILPDERFGRVRVALRTELDSMSQEVVDQMKEEEKRPATRKEPARQSNTKPPPRK